jgi:DnaJ-class molecular chaperone
MSKNYYDILEVNKDAKEDEIKKSYKKLAVKWHPDKNMDNKEESERRFKEISEAYQVLSDPEKRQIYDNYGEEGLKDNGMGQNNPFNSPNDIFQMFFGGGRSPFESNAFFNNRETQKKTDAKVINVPITLKEYYHGSKKRITLKLKNLCKKCDGNGGLNLKTCNNCGGHGIKIMDRMIGPGMMQRIQTTCNVCNGSKKIAETKCNICNGDKIKVEEKQFLLVIEPGSENNEKKVFENSGDQLPNELIGDVIFILKEEDNSLFKRIGDDLIYKYNITLGDSIIGPTISFKHLNDENIFFKEPNIIKENSYSLVKNKGMPKKNMENSFGDLYVLYYIVYPSKILSNSEKDIIKTILPVTNIDNDNETNTKSKLCENFSLDNIHNKNTRNNHHQNHQHNVHNIFRGFM